MGDRERLNRPGWYHWGASNDGRAHQSIDGVAQRRRTTMVRPIWREKMLARWWRSIRPRSHDQAAAASEETLPLRALYLRRLYRLTLLDARPDLTAEERRLVYHVLDTTYRDCSSVGVRSQARVMLGLPRRS